MVPGARETVSADSVASGRRSAPYPPSGHRRRRGHLGPFSCPVRPSRPPSPPGPNPRRPPWRARRSGPFWISRPGSPGGRASRVCTRGYETERPYGNTAEYLFVSHGRDSGSM